MSTTATAGAETDLERQVREEQEAYDADQPTESQAAADLAAAADEPGAPEKEPEPKPTPPMMVPLPGDWTAIGTEFGGRQPDASEIKLLGGKMPIEGSFAKGTILDLHVRVKVTGVLGQDTVDAFGQEESTIRRHLARMISVKRLPS